MSKASVRREKWFCLGADAIQRLRPDFPRVYVCPLCRLGYPEEALTLGELTQEHVPPKSLGGKPLVLTCQSCNSKAGHNADIHALKLERNIDFFKGTLQEPLRARLLYKNVETTVDVTAVGNGVLVVGHPELTSPESQRALTTSLEESAQEGKGIGTLSIRLDGAQYRRQSALVSYLRTAYLAAFAVWGYRYVFHKEVERTVRQHLLRPDESILRVFSMTRPHDDKNIRCMMLVKEPKELQSFMVSFGRHSVFLPWPPSKISIYDYLSTQKTNEWQSLKLKGTLLTFRRRGQEVLWPQEPLHRLDWVNFTAKSSL